MPLSPSSVVVSLGQPSSVSYKVHVTRGGTIAGPDNSQDYQVLGGSSIGGTTTIMFRRLLFSADTNDRIIVPNNMSIIWCGPSVPCGSVC